MEKILELKKISKSYSGIRVLTDVDLELSAGEVICLVGENGAGKSTLIKILSGAEVPDSGEIHIMGQQYSRLDPKRSMDLQIATIYQDVDLVDSLTVADNIFLGSEQRRAGGFIDTLKQENFTEKLLKSLNMHIAPDALVETLSPGQKQNLQIAKALKRNARIIIMDEPTSSLGEEETQALMKLIQRLANEGIGIIYISHYLGEVFQIGQKAVVLKDGCQVAVRDLKTTDEDALIRDMVGRSASNFYKREYFPPGEGRLEIKNYTSHLVRNVSFSIKQGEIFGLGGLVGAGRTELIRLIYGCDEKTSGILLLNGQDITPISPKDAVNKGIYMIFENRKDESLFLMRSVRENIMLSSNEKRNLLDLKNEREIVKHGIQDLQIKVFDQAQEVEKLSGGNQQKVVLSRWLVDDGIIYIFDEPTKGVDVGAREEIYRKMVELAKEGKFIIMVSSSMPELLSMSDRIGVMREGELVSIVDTNEATEDSLLAEFIGI